LGGKKRRDEIVFGFRELGMGRLASQAGQLDWKTVDGRCVTDKEEERSRFCQWSKRKDLVRSRGSCMSMRRTILKRSLRTMLQCADLQGVGGR
jgi:hypothetical protein